MDDLPLNFDEKLHEKLGGGAGPGAGAGAGAWAEAGAGAGTGGETETGAGAIGSTPKTDGHDRIAGKCREILANPRDFKSLAAAGNEVNN